MKITQLTNVKIIGNSYLVRMSESELSHSAALMSGTAIKLLLIGARNETREMTVGAGADLLSIELGKVGEQLQTLIGKVCLSDVVLVLGLSGAAAYIWKQSVPDHLGRSSSSGFLRWLFAENRISGEVFRESVKNRRHPAKVNDAIKYSDNDPGLNILKHSDRGHEKFLKQRLFDLKHIRDTSRFRDVSWSRQSQSQKVEAEECCHREDRGAPDGEERLVTNPEISQDNDKLTLHRLSSKSEFYQVSSDMKNVMKNARDIRRLIRESSFDSLASDFSLELDFNIDLKSDILDHEEDEDITITDEKEEYVFDKSLLNRFENNQMWRLTNSTRESSLVSDYSYDFRADKPFRIHGGYTSDDLASLIGSQADALEWDEDCFMEDDAHGRDVADVALRHSAWLPEYNKELDLESELETIVGSSGISEMVSKMTREKMMARLPPSGASSVESLCDIKR